MNKPELIFDPAKVTRAWLTQVLNAKGREATVTSFTATSIGTGQVGENVRFSLQGSGDLPATLVGKFASPDPVSRQTGIDTLNYKREVYFYQHLRSRVAITTPDVLFADINPDTHDYVIVMEDLSPGEQGDQLGGCDVNQAVLAMVQLAHLHGPVWGDRSLLHPELITDRTIDDGSAMKAIYDLVKDGFLERYASQLNDTEKRIVNETGESIVAYMTGYQDLPTLIHIDYRLDNMMFGGHYPLAVVDWQSPAFGCALNDVAYFIGTSVKPQERASIEESLVRTYFDTLKGYENVSMTWDECWQYYRHHAPAGLIMAVVASMIVGETQRGNEMFMVMAKRSAQMTAELDAISVING